VLSDRDQQLLAVIGQGLAEEDPALAQQLGHRSAPGPTGGRRGSRWPGVLTGVLAGVVAPVVVLATMPTLPAVLIVIVLALVGRVAAMCTVDDFGRGPRRS
jgi:hypothetical protein